MGCTASKPQTRETTVVARAASPVAAPVAEVKPVEAVASAQASPVREEREASAPAPAVEEAAPVEEVEEISTPATEACAPEEEAIEAAPVAEEAAPKDAVAVEAPVVVEEEAAPAPAPAEPVLKSCMKTTSAATRARLLRRKQQAAADAAALKTEEAPVAPAAEARKESIAKKTAEAKMAAPKGKKGKNAQKTKKAVPQLNTAALAQLAAQVGTLVAVPANVTPEELMTARPIDSVRFTDTENNNTFQRLPSAMKSARSFGTELKSQEEAKKTVVMTDKKQFVKATEAQPEQKKKQAAKGKAKTKKSSKRNKKILGVDSEIYKQQMFAFQRMLTHASMLSEQLNCA